MNLLRTLSFALGALLLQACVIDVDHAGHHHPDRRLHRVDPGRAGDHCYADHQCSVGLVCFSGTCEPERVGIYVRGALVGPGRADGREWDADLFLPRYVWTELERARRAGTNALFDFMWSFARSDVSAPDVIGYGHLALDGRYDPELTIAIIEPDRPVRDAFEVAVRKEAGWTNVPLHEGLRITVELYDHDRVGDETIGIVEIDAWGIRDALAMGGVVWFDAWDATDGQLLLLGIEVLSESW